MSARPAWTNNIARLSREFFTAHAETDSERLSLRVPSTTEIEIGFLVHVEPIANDAEALLLKAWDLDYSRTRTLSRDDSLADLAAAVVSVSEIPYTETALTPDTAVPLYGVAWTSDPVFNVHVALSAHTNWISWHHWMKDFFAAHSEAHLATTSPADPLTEINLWVNERRVDFQYRANDPSQHYVQCYVWPERVPVASLSESTHHSIQPEWQKRIVVRNMVTRVLRPETLADAYQQMRQLAPRYLLG